MRLSTVLFAVHMAATALMPATAAAAETQGWRLRGDTGGDYAPAEPGYFLGFRPAAALDAEIRSYPLHSADLRPPLDAPYVNPGAETSLRGALDAATLRDPMMTVTRLEVEAANREIWRELLKFTPVISATLETNRYAGDDRFGNIGGDDSESFATLSASLTLLDGGQRFYGVKSARSRRDAAVFDALAARDQTTLQLIESWTQAIVGYREGGLSRETLGRLARLRKAVAAQKKAGFASASDIAAVDATIASARQSSAQIEAAAEKAASRATRMSGRAPGAKSPLPRLDAHLPDKGALVESAHRNNPELQAAASRYHAEIYSSRAAFGRHLPAVELTGRYRKTYEHAAYSSAHDGWTVGVRLNIPLVDLSTVADTAVEIKRKEAALYREAAALRGVEQQIDDLWADWTAARKTAAEADREIAARRKTADAARQRFEKGFGSLNEAVNAESDLYDARRAALRLDAQQTLLAAQLLVVSGEFSRDMLE